MLLGRGLPRAATSDWLYAMSMRRGVHYHVRIVGETRFFCLQVVLLDFGLPRTATSVWLMRMIVPSFMILPFPAQAAVAVYRRTPRELAHSRHKPRRESPYAKNFAESFRLLARKLLSREPQL